MHTNVIYTSTIYCIMYYILYDIYLQIAVKRGEKQSRKGKI